MKGWGVSVMVGWTDMYDFSARPIQLITGRTWKGSVFGGENPSQSHTPSNDTSVSVMRNDLEETHPSARLLHELERT